ncbi:MAG: GNAT family protein [Bacteroidota bacterium]
MKEKLNIRLLEKEDATELHNLIELNRKRLERYFPITVSQNSSLQASTIYVSKKVKQAEQKELYFFVILFNKKIAGGIILKNIDWRIPKGELAYFIGGEWEGKRIMSQAMDRAMSYLFNELGLNKLFIKCSPKNIPSRRLAVKKGFKLEGLLRQEFRIETGEVEDIEYYGKLKVETR